MLSLAIALTITSLSAIGNDAAYNKANSSFEPFYQLGNRKEFLCVGYLKNGGSAVWIGGPWVLTNLHVAEIGAREGETTSETMERDRSNSLFLTTRDGAEEIPVHSVHRPENLRKWDAYANDIALIRLIRPPKIKIDPIPISSITAVKGLRVVCSGYGRIGLGSTGTENSFQKPHRGLRFGFENVVDTLTNRGLIAKFTFDEKGLPLEGTISEGDSGSGMFSEVGNAYQLIGLNAKSDVGSGGSFYKKAPVYGAKAGGVIVGYYYPELKKTLETGNPDAFVNLSKEEVQKRLSNK